MISAGNTPQEKKLPLLEKSVVLVDLLKILLRLAKDNQALDNKKYLQLEQQLQEIGRMLGGWKKSTKLFQENKALPRNDHLSWNYDSEDSDSN